ncbi:uncharacterized protein LOC131647636 [Vicia villosa]|uniref:uncharacterized protein LOC131647636 n=1 Tax=Vicia villosa TaxID=3911 RepID=UPI00273AFC05|nr:uncharacterized protein LOC131647636 [Vicia villosa]
MLDSILELITQAASSSTFIFCFCNLIIVIILLDLKPSVNVHHKSEIHLSICETLKQEINSKTIKSLTQEKEVSRVVIDAEAKEEEEEEDEIVIEKDHGVDCNNDDVEIEENDDELRKRVEEFIEKVNKKWKEELLSTSRLVYAKNNNEILVI